MNKWLKFRFSLRKPCRLDDGDGNVPIVIGGCYRSGTTLLRRLLDSHSAIYCGPEVKFFRDFFGDFPKDELKHLRFFSTIRSLGLSSSEILRLFGDSYIHCLEMVATRNGKRRWAEKNPENVLYLKHWQTLLKGRFHFVLVVRHPLDTLASLCEVGFEKTVPKDYFGKVETYGSFVSAGLDYINKNPRRCSLVRYEDLVVSPEKTLTGLLCDIGEVFEKKMLKEFNSKKRGRGIEDPKVLSTSTVHTDSLGRWQEELSLEQIDLAVSELEYLFPLLGYDMPDKG